jgi:hypothetical protein
MNKNIDCNILKFLRKKIDFRFHFFVTFFTIIFIAILVFHILILFKKCYLFQCLLFCVLFFGHVKIFPPLFIFSENVTLSLQKAQHVTWNFKVTSGFMNWDMQCCAWCCPLLYGINTIVSYWHTGLDTYFMFRLESHSMGLSFPSSSLSQRMEASINVRSVQIEGSIKVRSVEIEISISTG